MLLGSMDGRCAEGSESPRCSDPHPDGPGEEVDRIRSDPCADDYVVKPFSPGIGGPGQGHSPQGAFGPEEEGKALSHEDW